MIHFVPDSHGQMLAAPFARGMQRMAALRQALSLVEGLAGRPPSADADAGRVATIAGRARRDWFEARSLEAVASSSAGLEALAALGISGGQANRAAAEHLADHIRGRLEDLGAILSL